MAADSATCAAVAFIRAAACAALSAADIAAVVIACSRSFGCVTAAAACAACLVQLNSKAFRRGLACLSACVGIVCGIHMLEAGYDIASYWMMDHVRTQTLRQEISELDEPAAANIISYGIEPYTKWCGAYGLPNIRENGGDSLALGRARWFGVTSITATETRTYPFAGHTNETYAAGETAAENAESMD